MQGASRDLTFKQRRASVRTHISFGPREFTYGMRDRISECELTADYVSVPTERGRIERADRSGLAVSVLVLLIGLALVTVDVQSAQLSLPSALFVLPGLVLVGFVLTRKVRLTTIKLGGRTILIIEDRRLPKILAEFEARRRSRVTELYSPLNLANDPDMEIRKIEWLAAQSLLTREDADNQIAQVYGAHAPRPALESAATQESVAN